MKIAIVNDTHAGARQESLHFNSYFMKFWNGVFFPYLEEHNIKQVVHLGDLVDRRKFMNYVILHSWRTNIFDRFEGSLYNSKCDYYVDYLAGNHDVPYRNTNYPNAQAELLHGYDHATLFAEPTEVERGGLLIGYVPWINSGNYEESIDFIKNTKAQILMGHFEISGFEMDKGHVCDTGLDKSLFERFRMVISGHFHTKSTDGTIFYLGSQYEMTWTDYGDKKGFHVFDTDTCTLEFIRNPHEIFHKIWYDDTVQDHAFWKSQDLSMYKDCYVKMIVSNKNNPFLFDKAIELLYRENPVEIVVAEDYGTIHPDSVDVINQAEDTPTIVNKYIDSLSLTENINKDKVKNIAREVYVEALGMESQQQ